MLRRIRLASPWLLLAVILTILTMPVIAYAADDSDDDEDGDNDDDEPLKPAKRGKVPSHFEVKPSERLGVSHSFTPNFSLEAFFRGQQSALDNPLSLRSSQLGGGLQSTYKSGGTTWFVVLEDKEIYSRFYQHPTRNNTELRTALQQQISIGQSAFSVTPRVQAGYQWSTDSQQARWKFEVRSPLNYQLNETVVLLPFFPKLSYQVYTRRADNRSDVTMTLMTGIRWIFAAPSYLEMDFGYENRWSNVHSAESSRWKLTPQLNVRFTF